MSTYPNAQHKAIAVPVAGVRLLTVESAFRMGSGVGGSGTFDVEKLPTDEPF